MPNISANTAGAKRVRSGLVTRARCAAWRSYSMIQKIKHCASLQFHPRLHYRNSLRKQEQKRRKKKATHTPRYLPLFDVDPPKNATSVECASLLLFSVAVAGRVACVQHPFSQYVDSWGSHLVHISRMARSSNHGTAQPTYSVHPVFLTRC
jgi:hypothetical protein